MAKLSSHANSLVKPIDWKGGLTFMEVSACNCSPTRTKPSRGQAIPPNKPGLILSQGINDRQLQSNNYLSI